MRGLQSRCSLQDRHLCFCVCFWLDYGKRRKGGWRREGEGKEKERIRKARDDQLADKWLSETWVMGCDRMSNPAY